MTHIERLQSSGIRRFGTANRGFRYEHANGEKVAGADRERIELLKIPPAWSDVAINAAPKGRLQAIGKDAAGRWQYLYHENHTRSQDRRKFQRLIKFAQALPAMRTTIAKHLRQPDLGRERVLACVLRILSTCFLRSGSEVYASENGSYGIATLRPKHVKVKGDLVEFDFPGKSGVRQIQEIRDRQVARVIRGMLKQPGAEVFKYKNGAGEFVDLKSRHINEYIKEVMGGHFSAKDFRTWAGTLVCACALARAGNETGEKKTARRKKIVAAIKETAATLGNTPAVCRSSYICPEILNGFESGRIIDNNSATLAALISHRGKRLHATEKSLLNFLKRTATK
jgi:DNA topoisomerase I